MKRERVNKMQHGVLRTPGSSLHRDKIQVIDRLSLLSVVIHLIRSRDVCVTFEVTRVRCSLAFSLSPPPSLSSSFQLNCVRLPYPMQEKKDAFEPVRLLPRFFSRVSLSTLSLGYSATTSLTILARKGRERALLH